jgi:LysM repeat protein
MRQFKRVFYVVLLNVVISALTILAVLQWWKTRYPTPSGEVTQVIVVVTAAQTVVSAGASNMPANVFIPTNSGLPITGTLKATPTFGYLSYKVKEGDYLGALAIQFNVSMADLLAANGLDDPDSLYVGQIIYIPNAPLPTATATALPPTAVESPTPRPSATVTPKPTPTATPTEIGQAPNMVISKVVGAGVLVTERVELIRSGIGELSLEGWRLEDG